MVFLASRKIKLIKFIDYWFGTFLARILPALNTSSRANNLSTARVLFIRPGGLGDALLHLPAIELFAKKYPDAQIDILAESRNQAAFSFLKIPHHVELYTDPGSFFRLRKKHYDVVIDTEQWYRLSTVYARLLKPGRLIGFSTNERARLLTDKVSYSQEDYELESFFRLLEPLGIVADQSEKKLGIVLEQKTVEQTKFLLGSVDGEKWIAIFPGASLPEKRWPTENYCEIVKELQGKGFGVVIVGGETEREVASVIEVETDCTNLVGKTSLSETGCLNLVGKTSLAETGGVLTNTDLLISGDSAVLHLAASLDVPTVSLFGPSSPAKWAPQGEKHRFLQEQFDCVPCSRYGHIPPCSYDVKCLNNITPEDVLAAALGLLKS